MHVLVFSANVLWKEWGEQQGWTWKWLLSFSLYERVNWTVWVKCWGEGINVGCGVKLPYCSDVTPKGVRHVVENCTQLREINLEGCHEVCGFPELYFKLYFQGHHWRYFWLKHYVHIIICLLLYICFYYTFNFIFC